MSVIVNDLTIEPKTAEPPKAAEEKKEGGAKAGPEMERELDKYRRRMQDRVMRLWAH